MGRIGRVAGIAVLSCAFGLLLGAGCTGRRGSLPVPGEPTEGSAGFAVPYVELPAKYAADSSGLASGYSYDGWLPRQLVSRVTEPEVGAQFEPDYNPALESNARNLAYAMYVFDGSGLDYRDDVNGLRLTLDWADPALVLGSAWVGLADQQREYWKWLAADENGIVGVQGVSQYLNGEKQLLCAVALTGTTSNLLHQIRLNVTHEDYYEVEDNDTREEATQLPDLPFTMAEVKGSIGWSDDYSKYDEDDADWLTFELSQPGWLIIETELTSDYISSTSHFSFELSRLGESENLEMVPLHRPAWQEKIRFAYCEIPGQYWLEVRFDHLPGRHWGEYKIGMALGGPMLYENETKPGGNDDYAHADPLPPLPFFYGDVVGSVGLNDDPYPSDIFFNHDGDTEDWFSFTVDTPGVATFKSFVFGDPIGIDVYYSDGTTCLNQWWSLEQDEAAVIGCPKADKYYVKVSSRYVEKAATYFIQFNWNNQEAAWASVYLNQPVNVYDLDMARLGNNPVLLATSGLPEKRCLFQRASAPEGINWTVAKEWPLASLEAGYCKLAFEQGKPSAAFADFDYSGPFTVKYANASDDQGLEWNAPVVASTCSGWLLELDLAADDNRKFIVYNQDESPEYRPPIYITHALDASGAEWSEPVAVGNGYLPRVCVLDGRPAVFFRDPYFNLAVLRASDSAGELWNTAAVKVFADEVCRCFDINCEGEFPAVVMSTGYPSYADSRLLFSTANDAAGSTWGPVLELDPQCAGDTVALAMIKDRLSIAYTGIGGIRYIRAFDSGATVWSASESVGGHSETFYGLLELAGRPVIAYRGDGYQLFLATRY